MKSRRIHSERWLSTVSRLTHGQWTTRLSRRQAGSERWWSFPCPQWTGPCLHNTPMSSLIVPDLPDLRKRYFFKVLRSRTLSLNAFSIAGLAKKSSRRLAKLRIELSNYTHGNKRTSCARPWSKHIWKRGFVSRQSFQNYGETFSVLVKSLGV